MKNQKYKVKPWSKYPEFALPVEARCPLGRCGHGEHTMHARDLSVSQLDPYIFKLGKYLIDW